MERPKISIVLGTYNRLSFLKLFLDSLRKEMNSFPYETIIIDGGSNDGTIPWLAEQKDVILILQHNHGKWNGKKIERKPWGYFMNLGFKCAQGKYICMLSDDCLIVPGSIINGYNLFEQKLNEGLNVGAVAFYWRNWPGQKKYWVGLTLGNKMFVNHGIFLKKALEKVDFIDEDNFRFYHADGDLCLKMWQKGYEVIDSPNSYIEHFAHANLRTREENFKTQKDDWDNYLKKWNGVFYNPEKNNIGGWKEKEYFDEKSTIKKWYFISHKLLFFSKLKSFLKKFKKISI